MIDHIRGTVSSKEPTLVVIECGGVGYACRTSMQTAAAVGAVDEEALLYTRLTVREDEIALYGFASRGERGCFDQLTAVSGIGPKAALAILSDFTPDRFALAVAAGDYTPTWTSANGWSLISWTAPSAFPRRATP